MSGPARAARREEQPEGDYVAEAIPGLDQAPTRHGRLTAWVAEIAALTRPARVHWCDGSQREWEQLTGLLTGQGTLTRLNPGLRPDSFAAFSDPSDVARVEDRTFICPEKEQDAGPTNNWIAPARMRATLAGLLAGCMQGRVMYVVPFCLGPLGSAISQLGVEITNSAYVAASMRIMTRMGTPVLAQLGEDGFFVRAVHSVGAPLRPGQPDVAWPCNPVKYISHFPETREIWSFGSGYGGNALLGKKCYALRIASVMARDEGWLAEHMLILKIIPPGNGGTRARYIAAAFPSGFGKTNLAMMVPTISGWRVETIGDDIAWMRFGPDGQLRAINPEAGFFGVAPGTGPATNPNAVTMLRHGTIFTNVARTADGDVWWEGLTGQPPQLTDWQGRTGPRSPASPPPTPTPASACPPPSAPRSPPNGRTRPGCRSRRSCSAAAAPPRRRWSPRPSPGSTACSSACMASEKTAAAAGGQTGELRRDPFAMLPFCGYNMGDYFAHWLAVGATADPAKLPRIYHVNWFRKTPAGTFAWPGYGENSRVLKWVCQRLSGQAGAVATPIGNLPAPGALDTAGLAVSDDDLRVLLSADPGTWQDEAALIGEHLASFGRHLPGELQEEHDALLKRLSAAS
jgi:phosphoenolpyruvate carboxykinase (GTP)